MDVISLREMVDNAGDHMIKVVDDLLDTLTNGEHRRAIKALETDQDKTAVRLIFLQNHYKKYLVFWNLFRQKFHL